MIFLMSDELMQASGNHRSQVRFGPLLVFVGPNNFYVLKTKQQHIQEYLAEMLIHTLTLVFPSFVIL